MMAVAGSGIWNWIWTILAAVALYLGGAWMMQRMILFPSPRAMAAAPLDAAAGMEMFTVEVGDAADGGRGGEVEVFFLPGNGSGPRPLIIFAHGNGELADDWVRDFREPARQGYSVALVEYPGYGRSGGSASEQTVTEAILGAYDRLVLRADIDSGLVVGYGRSLGGGAVCQLATHRGLAALILESTFTDVPSMAARFGMPEAMVQDRFDNLSVVQNFAGPILLIHGAADEIVPYEHAGRLHDVAVQSELVTVAHGHNDMPRLWSRIFDFLSGRLDIRSVTAH